MAVHETIPEKRRAGRKVRTLEYRSVHGGSTTLLVLNMQTTTENKSGSIFGYLPGKSVFHVRIKSRSVSRACHVYVMALIHGGEGREIRRALKGNEGGLTLCQELGPA